jgi:hypothetical protein
MKNHYLFCFLITISFAACSPIYSYFTDDLYRQQKWTQDDIQRIQFYLSKDIVLSRSLSEGETKIKEGKIIVKDGQQVEQVVIKSGTPGVLVLMPKDDRFGISFEDDDNAYLMFGPNPKIENRYALLAQEWEQDAGQVHYKGNLYSVDSESAFACLKVDLKKTGSDEYQTHKATGRTVKGL